MNGQLTQSQREKLADAVKAFGRFLECRMSRRNDVTMDFVVTLRQGGIRWINVSERVNKEKIL